jgi:hypothetical protein
MQFALLALAVGGVLFGPVWGGALQPTVILLLVGLIWVVLSFRSMRDSRIAADSSSLIAAGQYDAAEQRLSTALHSFSLFKTVKLLSLHHLAVLRHAQKRWRDSAMLAQALLRQPARSLSGLNKSARLILIDALLEMGDRRAAHEAIVSLYTQRLSLSEAVKLMGLQLDYEAQIGAWDAMMQRLGAKIQLAELSPTASAALSQALLALAARRTGRSDCENWLRRRAELLVEPAELATRRPILRELWP